MKTTTKLAMAAAVATLVACNSKARENNASDVNATTDMNAVVSDMNTTDMNAAGGNMAGNGMGSATTNY